MSKTEYTDNITCPHCGHEETDPTDFYSDNIEEPSETDCGECGKPFKYWAHISITWSTKS